MQKCANCWCKVLHKIGIFCASRLLYVCKVGIASCDCLVMSIRMFSSRTNELCALSLLLYCALDYSAYDWSWVMFSASTLVLCSWQAMLQIWSVSWDYSYNYGSNWFWNEAGILTLTALFPDLPPLPTPFQFWLLTLCKANDSLIHRPYLQVLGDKPLLPQYSPDSIQIWKYRGQQTTVKSILWK